MKLFIIFLTLCCIKCSNQNNHIEFNSIAFKYNFHIFQKDSFINIIDSFYLFDFTKIKVIEIPVKLKLFSNNVYKKDSVIYDYFIYKKDTEIGYLFNIKKKKLLGKFQVKTFIKENILDFSAFQFSNESKKYSSHTNFSGYNLIEKYIENKDFSYPDTAIYYFQKKFPNLDYSISKEMENEKNMKLVKLSMKFNKKYDAVSNLWYPDRISNLELVKAYSNSYNELSNFINWFIEQKNL